MPVSPSSATINDGKASHPAASHSPATSQPPLAYQRGYQDFYGRDFLVTPDVLIPRPESEQIIDLVLTLAGRPYLPDVKAPERVLPPNPLIIDVGTGSGCLAITIKKELPEAQVIATDISDKAIQIATQNARRLDVSINFIISHLCQKVNSLALPDRYPRGSTSENTIFAQTSSTANATTDTPIIPDVIVANLPYVDPSWNWLDKHALSYEPAIALYAADHGLQLIKELIDQLIILYPPSSKPIHLILEADPCQHDTIITYAKNHSLTHASTHSYILHFIRNK